MHLNKTTLFGVVHSEPTLAWQSSGRAGIEFFVLVQADRLGRDLQTEPVTIHHMVSYELSELETESFVDALPVGAPVYVEGSLHMAKEARNGKVTPYYEVRASQITPVTTECHFSSQALSGDIVRSTLASREQYDVLWLIVRSDASTNTADINACIRGPKGSLIDLSNLASVGSQIHLEGKLYNQALQPSGQTKFVEADHDKINVFHVAQGAHPHGGRQDFETHPIGYARAS